MAISATINKVSLTISDMDKHYYQSHELTMAQHPSENNFRCMIRLIAFAINAHEQLTFTKGLGDEEPELWQKALTGDIELWIDFGQLDEKRIRKACGRAKEVIIYTYNQRKADVWWEQHADKFQRYKNLSIVFIDAEGADKLVSRNMTLQCNIQDCELYLTDNENSIDVSLHSYK